MDENPEENKSKKLKSASISNSESDLYVWPWMGVIANIPTKFQNGRRAGESGTKLKAQLAQFNPLKVSPIWNFKGHTGFAIVDFRKNWHGFKNLMGFESHFEAQNKGRRDFEWSEEKEGIYGWIAKEEDYFGTGPVHLYLVKNGDLKTIGDVQFEEAAVNDKILSCLAKEILVKNISLREMESKCLESEEILDENMRERDEMLRIYSEEVQKMENFSNANLHRIMEDNLKLREVLESKKKEAEQANHNLLETKKISGGSVSKLSKEMKSLELATIEKQRADERILKLVEEHKTEKEGAMRRILELETQLQAKQNLELEIHQLRSQMERMEALEMIDPEFRAKMEEELREKFEELRQTVEELEEMETLNQTLGIKESRSSQELEEARNELVKGLEDISRSTTIGIKRMGEISEKAFQKACEIKFHRSNVKREVELLLQKWQNEIKSPNWHPFKSELSNGSVKEVINKEDEKLQGLTKALGDEAYEAVITALMEIKEYNPVWKCPVPEIWNFKENRKATMVEATRFALNGLKLHKKKRERN